MKVLTAVPAERTLFNTPVVSTILRWLSTALLALSGWRKRGTLPDRAKYVMIAAPHTSNWDLPITLMFGFAFRARVHWMGKNSLFRRPFGSFFRWLGGVPIDRSRANDVVRQTIGIFGDRDAFVLVVAPEGTRKQVAHWKTGFYHIAHGAGVPIALGFLDYATKTGGIGPVISPSGDIEADMGVIRDFYADISGKYAREAREAPAASSP